MENQTDASTELWTVFSSPVGQNAYKVMTLGPCLVLGQSHAAFPKALDKLCDDAKTRGLELRFYKLHIGELLATYDPRQDTES